MEWQYQLCESHVLRGKASLRTLILRTQHSPLRRKACHCTADKGGESLHGAE
eukprot:IDg5285t1